MQMYGLNRDSVSQRIQMVEPDSEVVERYCFEQTLKGYFAWITTRSISFMLTMANIGHNKLPFESDIVCNNLMRLEVKGGDLPSGLFLKKGSPLIEFINTA
jgi:hypothetical protein